MRGRDCTWPLTGLRLFITTPRLWPKALLASTLRSVVLALLAVILLWWNAPEETGEDALAAWGQALARTATALVAVMALLIPLTKGATARAVLRPVLRHLGQDLPERGAARSFGAKLGYLGRTMPLRIAWIVAAIAAGLWHPWAGAVVAAWALGHLMVLDSRDQALGLVESEADARRGRVAGTALASVIAGGIAGAAAVALGITVFGWLLWGPGIVAGAAWWAVDAET